MVTTSTAVRSRQRNIAADHSVRFNEAAELALKQSLAYLHQVIPPLWPLADYVAVNPCQGFADKPLLCASEILTAARGYDLLMSREYFQTLLDEGTLSMDDLRSAYEQCLTEYPEWYRALPATELEQWLSASADDQGARTHRYRTVAEVVDQALGSTWGSHITNDITRHCAAHFDEGQASWASPWKSSSLFTAWRESAQLSRRMKLLGMAEFTQVVAALPANPRAAVIELLSALGVPPSRWRMFLLCEALSVSGWAAYLRYRARQSEIAGGGDDDLIGLVAMRLAYDVALSRLPEISTPLPLWPADVSVSAEDPDHRPADELLARYTLQVAAEHAYRRTLLQNLAAGTAVTHSASRKTLQMVFCIDVRSEVMRRHLESTHESIETFGFAGFFGMPIEFMPLGSDTGTPHCPVLLQPGYRVREEYRGLDDAAVEKLTRQQTIRGHVRKMWKSTQSSAAGCFSYVEALGLTYLGKLLTDSLRWNKPAASCKAHECATHGGATVGLDIVDRDGRILTLAQRTSLAEGMLRNLGLTDDFARLVTFCGHAAEVTNNPYRAALDCGACGGHSGEPNARSAAAILNDADVRRELATRGISIPDDTWFLAALHNTTTDAITISDRQSVPASHADALAQVDRWIEQAGTQTRCERARRFGSDVESDLPRRSRDWSEVRPEWGLAGNAAFIVAPRSRTTGLDLGGRSFLHSYDHHCDPELKVLELIMTAPMVVTNWINMQYYASTVRPDAFGSGNKVIHNVVGEFGVLEGNGGDLKTGLPWQCVHDGARLQHEPLRLQVIIDAPRSSIETIIERHSIVRNLVTNGWVHLIAWEGDEFYCWSADETWKPAVSSVLDEIHA
ncbi:MAG: DUF2309 domain-containing protein [Planctomycetaceae bacterium]